MLTDDFSYDLPEHLIAQHPSTPRDSCRLLVASPCGGAIVHETFSNIGLYIKKGDRLVFNNTRVMPARVLCRKSSGGKCEVFFLEPVYPGVWKALVKPGSNARNGGLLYAGPEGNVALRIIDVLADGERLIEVADRAGDATIETIMDTYGHIPLPHYIARNDESIDRDDYQTVFAAIPGAVAAPTAGLHFTESLLRELRDAGIDSSFITLHVGVGTFRPVKAERPQDHIMHEERYDLSESAVAEIEETKARGGRIIAVGTTVVRVLEHCFKAEGKLRPHRGATSIMIYPPYQFRCVDALITNFHLPRSTLLMLVSAFAGRENILSVYRQAVLESYRFYSYGDAMFIR